MPATTHGIESVADEPALQPGVNALAFTYDFARDPALAPLALATQTRRGRVVNRMLHVNESSGDLLNKLEAVRLLCQETGCAQRYLVHDALNALGMYPGDAGLLGLEGAGVVLDVGPGVTDLAVGDRVMGMFTGAFGPVAVADRRLMAPMPDGW